MIEDKGEISLSGNQKIYPHCFAKQNKAPRREKIKNKANVDLGNINVNSLLTNEYKDF
jgi:hypothetical protein